MWQISFVTLKCKSCIHFSFNSGKRIAKLPNCPTTGLMWIYGEGHLGLSLESSSRTSWRPTDKHVFYRRFVLEVIICGHHSLKAAYATCHLRSSYFKSSIQALKEDYRAGISSYPWSLKQQQNLIYHSILPQEEWFLYIRIRHLRMIRQCFLQNCLANNWTSCVYQYMRDHATAFWVLCLQVLLVASSRKWQNSRSQPANLVVKELGYWDKISSQQKLLYSALLTTQSQLDLYMGFQCQMLDNSAPIFPWLKLHTMEASLKNIFPNEDSLKKEKATQVSFILQPMLCPSTGLPFYHTATMERGLDGSLMSNWSTHLPDKNVNCYATKQPLQI